MCICWLNAKTHFRPRWGLNAILLLCGLQRPCQLLTINVGVVEGIDRRHQVALADLTCKRFDIFGVYTMRCDRCLLAVIEKNRHLLAPCYARYPRAVLPITAPP